VFVNLTKHNKKVNYIKIDLSYIRIYFKQVEKFNLITKTKTSTTINLIVKTKILIIINLTLIIIKILTKTKTTTNLLTIANKY
jgi:hypothetical protein